MSHNSSASTSHERFGLQLASSIKRSLNSGEFSDVQFTVGRQFGPAQCFRAHKYVLSLRCSVFGAMFYGDSPQRCDQPIDIPDVIPAAFGNMLSFLYTGTVENLYMDNVIHTLVCAKKYDLPLLMEMCSDFVSAGLGVNNCLVILDTVVRFGADLKAIMERCLDLIDRCADELLQSEQFAQLRHKTIMMILQRGTLSAAEYNVYLAVERWAREVCKVGNVDPSPTNRRRMLGEALFLVRFPLLTNAQLADGPIKSGLLLQSEVQNLFQYRFATVKPPLPFSAQPRKAVGVGNVVIKEEEPVSSTHPAEGRVYHGGPSAAYGDGGPSAYTCPRPECEEAFSANYALQQHLDNRHGLVTAALPREDPQKKLLCRICNTWIASPKLKKHAADCIAKKMASKTTIHVYTKKRAA
ncbi:BTB/POZ domain-containing protein 6-B-like [Paramacrobiotus metropolitanus]|uniref:BTB/POZ domain-containing protein 6-B-like n=1 Tax=Paramacrobiotus metropolitanus TaxID=2943436 RepID=UPI00244636E0|nr:BTB/POZ domain-containing protein 6-B-like [Paramacrobiotus metropolitanus]